MPLTPLFQRGEPAFGQKVPLYYRGTRLPTPRSQGSYNAGMHGNLPAIATHAGIEAASCTWRWQAGGGQV